MTKRVFITKEEAKGIIDSLKFTRHDYGRHLGLNVKFYNFPENIQKILWESYKAENIFAYKQLYYYTTPLSNMWLDFKYYLKHHYNLDASQAGRSGGYWGTYLTEYNDIKSIKKAIKKALYYAFITNFNTNCIRVFEYESSLSNNDEEEIHFDATLYCNGKSEYYPDGTLEWVNYIKNEIIPIFEKDEDDKWEILANAYDKFLHAWDIKKYVCNVV